jgi:phospholipase D1/2
VARKHTAMVRILDPQHIWRRHRVDELGLIIDAEDYYRELYRAALTAKKQILFTGWQFDSDVELIRGEEAEAAKTPTSLVRFLNHLCETRPDLHVYILAWDFNVVFAPEREWMQEFTFEWTSHERLSFRFDSHHVELATQHQKFVVIDDEIVFTGGLDVCDHRWDSPSHCFDSPLRMSRGEPHQPFHDIQLYAKSVELARTLQGLFAKRWELSGGEPLAPVAARPPVTSTYQPASFHPLPANEIALHRTDPYGVPECQRPVLEIKQLYLSAIAKAQKLIYVETQYLSSRLITEALITRMRDADKPKLELVCVLNMRGETLKEQAALGLNQAQNLQRLREAGAETGHQVGLYYTLPYCKTDDERPERGTYIHSKLMIVDDRFLTIGSANLTNRSMGVDTELNVSVEAEASDDALIASIRDIRLALLSEHTGGHPFTADASMVAQISRLQGPSKDGCRLRVHPSPTEGEQTALALIDPDKLPFDPDHVEELDTGLFNALSRDWKKLWSAARDTPSLP